MMGRVFFGTRESQHLIEDELVSSGSSASPSTVASQDSRSISPTLDNAHCRSPMLKHPFMEETRRLLLPKSLPEEEPLSSALGALGLSCQDSDAPSQASLFPQANKCHLSRRPPHCSLSDVSAVQDAYTHCCSQPTTALRHPTAAASRVRSSSFSGSSDAAAPPPRPSPVNKGPWLPSGSHRTARLATTTSISTPNTTECFFSCEPDTSRDISLSGGSRALPRKRIKRTSAGDSRTSYARPSNDTEREALSATGGADVSHTQVAPNTPSKEVPGDPGEDKSRQIVKKKRRIGGFIGLLLSLFERDDQGLADSCLQNKSGHISSTHPCQPYPSQSSPAQSTACPSACTASTAPLPPILRSGVEGRNIFRSHSVGSASIRRTPRPANTAEPLAIPPVPRGPPQSASIPPVEERIGWCQSYPPLVGHNRRTSSPLCVVPAASGSPLVFPSPCLSGYSRLAQFADASQRLLRLAWSGCCVTVLVWLLLHLAISLYRDIKQGEEQRQLQNAAEAAHCRQQHRDNGCDTLDPLPPYLQQPCTDWKACLMRQPDSHGERTKVVAAVVGDVLNVFFQRLEWRTIACLALLLIAIMYASTFLAQPLPPPLIPPASSRSSPSDFSHQGLRAPHCGLAMPSPVVQTKVETGQLQVSSEGRYAKAPPPRGT
ncbi:di-sulfide bridge nucleocytoplasmic transport domain protein [Cystoisospora suis]|uniref:Di-sulfide bridge nucleocytoplasmic transport domain protein n=1 Tax=Cystoisospora suis TaxID=483139 RepID=A0A2C6L3N6_9APIC|nr:di-sulfide bridge nucleocytoplasmic transport domain protein [Cystoisospora suis]